MRSRLSVGASRGPHWLLERAGLSLASPSYMKTLLLLACIPLATAVAASRARNVILFLGDAGGLPTLNAAALYGHDRPQSLFIQQMPYTALADTSCLDRWVTDSAAGMTAIVTGRKTNEHMVSLLPARDGREARPLKTILEYAEEHGLATGVITNMPVWDATPAACYAHASSRKDVGDIFRDLLHPRFGDGVDVVIGADWKGLVDAAARQGVDAASAFARAKYAFYPTPGALPATATRAAAIYDGGDFEPQPVLANVLQVLARNRRGFFLMVEWDMHTDNVTKGLKRALVMDELIRYVAGIAPPDTLIVYAADHSFDLRLVGGMRGKPVAEQLLVAAPEQKPPPWPVFRVSGSHSGEEVLVAAQGPGAERLHGFIPNTAIFHLMMDAYGWKETP